MIVVFLSLILIFELIQQTALLNFILCLNIFKILKMSFWTFWRKITYLLLRKLLEQRNVNNTFKLHIKILWYSFSRNSRFLLTPSQFHPGKQESSSSCASRHINNSLSMYLFLDSELNNGGKKVQVKRAFKSFFCHQKKQLENRQARYEIFFSLEYKCGEVLISPISKPTPPFSATPSFWKNVPTLRSGSTKW